MEELDNWLHKHDTDPEIRHIIVTRFADIRDSNPPTPLTAHLMVQSVLDRQDDLGWYLPLTGFWMTEWEDLQDQCHKFRRKTRTG